MDLDKIKILVIDDEEDFTFFTKKNLQRSQYQVITAKDGTQGVSKAKTENPHLILLDIMMPGISGIEVLESLRSDPHTSKIPVIMLTGKDDDQSREKVKNLGGNEYLVKPVQFEDLHYRIDKVLGKI